MFVWAPGQNQVRKPGNWAAEFSKPLPPRSNDSNLTWNKSVRHHSCPCLTKPIETKRMTWAAMATAKPRPPNTRITRTVTTRSRCLCGALKLQWYSLCIMVPKRPPPKLAQDCFREGSNDAAWMGKGHVLQLLQSMQPFLQCTKHHQTMPAPAFFCLQ